MLGAERATTLMEHLPPVGWADVATKVDLAALRSDIKADLAELRADLTKTFVLTLVATNTTLAGFAVAATALVR